MFLLSVCQFFICNIAPAPAYDCTHPASSSTILGVAGGRAASVTDGGGFHSLSNSCRTSMGFVFILTRAPYYYDCQTRKLGLQAENNIVGAARYYPPWAYDRTAAV